MNLTVVISAGTNVLSKRLLFLGREPIRNGREPVFTYSVLWNQRRKS
jgi:hypothetical protein